MFIEHKTLRIKKTLDISTNYIESEIKKLGLTPLRWAITKVEQDIFIVDCAIVSK